MNAGSSDIRDPVNLLETIHGRQVFIWGARHDGYAARLALGRHGIGIAGYIDSSPALKGSSAFGLAIENPSDFFLREEPSRAFIIIASGFFADEIALDCEKNGWKQGLDYVVYGNLRRFNYQIDVAGACNLKCISCPRGNWPRHRKPGFMSADTFAQLVDKILTDDPWTGILTLYNWGEPLLNPQLPEIIRITREKGLLSAISSNLALEKDFENVIKAKPDWFRISNSGWGENYEITHTGADWSVFLNNCYKLAEYRRRHHLDMLVEMFFHIYSHNRDDFQKLQKLCDELGFTLRYRHAALAPLDNIERVLNEEPLTPAAQKTQELQFLHVDEVMKLAESEKDRPCFYLEHLWIDWDLSIAYCMEWYDPSLKMFPERNFLCVTLEEIESTRASAALCIKCRQRGIHRAYNIYGDEKLIARKLSIPCNMSNPHD